MKIKFMACQNKWIEKKKLEVLVLFYSISAILALNYIWGLEVTAQNIVAVVKEVPRYI